MLDKCEMPSFRLIGIKRASIMEYCVPDIEVNTFTCSILIKFHHHLKSEILSLLPYADEIKEGYTICKSLLKMKTLAYVGKICAFT